MKTFGRLNYPPERSLNLKKSNPIKLRSTKLDPRIKPLLKYGITPNQWDKMFDMQKGECPICLRPISRPGNLSGRRAASVDHDHKTKRVRGLLCYRCNRFTIGRHRHTDMIERVIAYLKSDFDGRKI